VISIRKTHAVVKTCRVSPALARAASETAPAIPIARTALSVSRTLWIALMIMDESREAGIPTPRERDDTSPSYRASPVNWNTAQ